MSDALGADLGKSDRRSVYEFGSVQSFGFLVALSPEWMVRGTSANIADFAGRPCDQIIGHHVNSVFCPDAVHDLRNRLALLRGANSIERSLRCALFGDERLFDVALQSSDRCVIIEAETASEHSYGDVTGTVRGMMRRVDNVPDMTDFFAEGAHQMRALTGFDRVTVSRFCADGSSEVIAGSARSGFDAILGFPFPSSELCNEEREFDRHGVPRVIVDTDAPAIAILLAQGEPLLDLGLCVLRPISPLHAMSLRAIGARASMSISIIIKGEPWGLIACHHRSPRCASFERRSVAELFAQMFGMRLENRELREVLDHERAVRLKPAETTLQNTL